MLSWKRVTEESGEQMLTVDEIVVAPGQLHSRVKVEVKHEGAEPGSTLRVGQAEEEDAGQYICEMMQKDNRQAIKHTVKIRGE